MATEVALFNTSNVPAFAKKAELSTLAKSLAGSGGSGKRISIKGGTFRLLVDGEEIASIEERYLDVVIVNASPKVGRMYYEGEFSEEKVVGPTCWSADGEKPDASIKHPQNKTCAGCPQDVKGSGKGDTRACRFSQRLAVVLANDMEGAVMQLSVPAKSLFGKEETKGYRPLQAYAKWLAAQQVNPDMVVTRMKFDTSEASPKLYFKPMRWLEEDEYKIAQAQHDTPDAISAITMTVAQTDHVAEVEEPEDEAPAPKAAKTNGKAKPAPAPADDDEDEAPPPKAKKAAKAAPADDDDESPAPEPTKRTGKAKPVAEAAPAPKIANLVAQWGEDD